MILNCLNKIDTIVSGLSFIHVKFCKIREISLADTEFVKNFILQFLSNDTGNIGRDSLFHLLSGQWFKLCFCPCKKVGMEYVDIYFKDQRPRGEFDTV